MRRERPDLPPPVVAALRRADRLEWWTIFWLLLIVAAMSLALGGSQAFRTAWVEDLLSLLPPCLYLLARRWADREPTPGFPYGFHRIGTLTFFLSAAALTTFGGLLLYNGGHTLLTAQHPTVGSIQLFGREAWQGWPMLAALGFSVVPPVILGHKKRQVAERLHDKTLTVDAEMNAADWQTGAAGMAGIVGIGFGLWWADAVMAMLISLGILRDGLTSLQRSGIALLDGAPRRRESNDLDRDAARLIEALHARFADASVQVHETGRFLRATVKPAGAPHLPEHLARELLGAEGWRLIDLTVAVRDELPPPRDALSSPATRSCPGS
jgi:divalent metal cation (Fe/Co/Zn/Cd) transporter